MVSKARRFYSGATGRVAERRFVRAAEKKGLIVTKSSRNEDIQDHVDYWLSLEVNTKWGVDVKGNNLPDEIWCEFKNVRGDKGWMYGSASIIAFDMPEEGGFAIVDRKELAEFCEGYVSDEVVRDKKNAYRKRYTRKDRQDVITKLNLQDIKQLESYRVWEYQKDY